MASHEWYGTFWQVRVCKILGTTGKSNDYSSGGMCQATALNMARFFKQRTNRHNDSSRLLYHRTTSFKYETHTSIFNGDLVQEIHFPWYHRHTSQQLLHSFVISIKTPGLWWPPPRSALVHLLDETFLRFLWKQVVEVLSASFNDSVIYSKWWWLLISSRSRD